MQSIDHYTKNRVRGTCTFVFEDGSKTEYEQTTGLCLFCTCPTYLRVYACSHICEIEYLATNEPNHDAFRKDFIQRFQPPTSSDSEASSHNDTETTYDTAESGSEQEEPSKAPCCTVI